jgi:transposase
MTTRKFALTEAEANSLQAAYLHMHNADTKIRFQAVRLFGLGYAVAEIRSICGGSQSSLYEWVQLYQQSGLTALLDHRKGGNYAKLQPDQIEAIHTQLQTYTPAQLLGRDGCSGLGQFWTRDDLARLVERDYGVVYHSPTSYYSLLAKCGLSLQYPDKHFKSHNASKLMDFEELLEKK